MGNWEDVELAGRKIRINQVKYWAWTKLCAIKLNEAIMASDLLLICLNDEDRAHWQSIDYDPDNAELSTQINNAFSAMWRMNPKIAPKQKASSTPETPANTNSGTTPTGSPKSSDGP